MRSRDRNKREMANLIPLYGGPFVITELTQDIEAPVVAEHSCSGMALLSIPPPPTFNWY